MPRALVVQKSRKTHGFIYVSRLFCTTKGSSLSLMFNYHAL
jgi:hypothetical protein